MALPTRTIVVSASTSDHRILAATANYDLTVEAGVTVSVTDTDAIVFRAGAGARANDATVTVNGTLGVETSSITGRQNGISFLGQNAVSLRIGVEGVIDEHRGQLTAISAQAERFSMINLGTISAYGGILANVVSDFEITNRGTIRTQFQPAIHLLMQAGTGETARFHNSGSIQSANDAVRLELGGMSGPEIVNTGQITVDGDLVPDTAVALTVTDWAGHATMINRGSIVGKYHEQGAVLMSGVADQSNSLRLTNSGQLLGAVTLEFSEDVLINSGKIGGLVSLNDGDDRYVVSGQGLTTADVLGGAGADTLLGGAEMDSLFGGLGQDLLRGGLGNDQLNGGDDEDMLTGGAGDDVLEGGFGADVLRGEAGGDVLRDEGGDDRLYGGSGGDTVKAGDGDDVIYGGAGADLLEGREGDDTLLGGAGADGLKAGGGADVLRGGAGSDTLSAGLGEETLTGGRDADLFEFMRWVDPTEGAVVTDFENGIDRLHFAHVDHGVTEFDFAVIAPYAQQVGADVVMDLRELGFGLVVLRNLALADLDASDFRVDLDPL